MAIYRGKSVSLNKSSKAHKSQADRINKIVATYTKYKPLTETKQRDVIKGVLKGLYKK